MSSIAIGTYRSLGITDEEYARIVELLGRPPTETELGMFSVQWSEHCSYKCSRPVLAYFKRYHEAMETGGLENAGVVEIGDGLGVVMKVESHNHPSAVEPYQGAATGVGGIVRDILTMGARPIAALNSLRFGPLEEGPGVPREVAARNRHLFERVVEGIAGYGNCVGVPMVGGEVDFHPRYSGNPLVNAMCVGLVPLDRVTTAAAAGVGNPVLYLGSETGRDGIHGASFASEALGEDSEAKRPNVQIGDPFAEKALIEATLEALSTGAVQSIQDMGAAGLTCSTTEMAAKGGVGMEIDLDLVPVREPGLTAYELMLSESQERMLCVAHAGREGEVVQVFRKWGLHAVVVGRVTESGLRFRRDGKVVVDAPARAFTEGCPVRRLVGEEPASHRRARAFRLDGIPPRDLAESLLALLGSPGLASKAWVYGQYDQQVQCLTALRPGFGDAAVLALRGTRKGLALAIDGNGRWTFAHPYAGGQLAVVEAARNVACTGARPRAATDGLNFGDPNQPHVFWQLERAVRGIADACEALDVPVVSGNVSLYNESELGEVLPTPTVGVLGVLEDAAKRIGSAWDEGQAVGLLWVPLDPGPQMGLGASSYLAVSHGIEDGVPLLPDLGGEAALMETLARLAERGLVRAAHDVSEGGLAFALAEMAIGGGVGANLALPEELSLGPRPDAVAFGEVPGIVAVAYDPELEAAVGRTTLAPVRFAPLGRTGGPALWIHLGTGAKLELDVATARARYAGAIPTALGSSPRPE